MKKMTAPEPHGLFARARLSSRQRDEMFALLSRHFEGVTRRQFEHDLDQKKWVIEVRKLDRLIGFSTLLVSEVIFEGRSITAIYSGDTIVSPEGWGTPSLARGWIASVNHLRREFPTRPCHWLLLTSGFRTYRFLPVFWREFFPRFDRSTPPDRQRLLNFLAKMHYGDLYDESAGLVRFSYPQRLRGLFSTIPVGRDKDVHIAHFLARNPRHIDGDELVCLTEISETNLTPAGARMVKQAGR